MSPLLWTSKSLDKLCAALKDMQHGVCPNVVAKLLADQDGISLLAQEVPIGERARQSFVDGQAGEVEVVNILGPAAVWRSSSGT